MGKKPIIKMECSICYESLAEEPAAPTAPKRGRRPDPKNPKNTSVLVCPPCGHIYHRICIEEWILTKQSTCPNCRKSFEKRALKAVFLPTAGTTAQTGNDKKDDGDDDDDDVDDDGEKGKEPCGKCDKLVKQLEELKKEKEGLQKELAAEKKEVQSLHKYVQDLTPSSPGNGQQSTAADEDSDPSDDEDGFFSSLWN